MRKWDLANFTWPEVKNALPEVDAILVPVGSFEQHGPHTPFETDTRIARGLAEKAAVLAQKKGGYLLVGPSVNMGYSWYHMDFPGSITLEGNTFVDVIRQICHSLHYHGFKNIILLNAHGGNVVPLNMAVTFLREELSTSIYHVNYADLITDIMSHTDDCLIHAGEVETSICLALGIRVEMDRAVTEATDRQKTIEKKGVATSRYFKYDAHHNGPGAAFPMQRIIEMSSSGVVGDPTKANKEFGKELVAKASERIAQLCIDLSGHNRKVNNK